MRKHASIIHFFFNNVCITHRKRHSINLEGLFSFKLFSIIFKKGLQNENIHDKIVFEVINNINVILMLLLIYKSYWGIYKMKNKLNKVLALGVAVSIWAGGQTAEAAAKPVIKKAASVSIEKHVTGIFTGLEDPHTFEAKIGKTYISFQCTNGWYLKTLKRGQRYTYFYKTNSYGQNVITKVNK